MVRGGGSDRHGLHSAQGGHIVLGNGHRRFRRAPRSRSRFAARPSVTSGRGCTVRLLPRSCDLLRAAPRSGAAFPLDMIRALRFACTSISTLLLLLLLLRHKPIVESRAILRHGWLAISKVPF